MSDACDLCHGRGWNWNGQKRLACRRCNPPSRVLADPVRTGNYTLVDRDAWPAIRDQLSRQATAVRA